MEKAPSLAIWMLAIRPKTLIASICPVLIGNILAYSQSFDFFLFVCILLSALFIQIGTNIANDYYDFVQGADTKMRKGPTRVTQSGLIPLKIVKQGFIFSFALAVVFGLYPMYKGGLPIVSLGIISLALGIFYTKGKYSLAYTGLADICVLLFFGVFATGFTYYMQTGLFLRSAFIAGLGPGAISTAILCANNLRDIEEDRQASKKTLVVRFGKKFGRLEYIFCLSLASSILFFFAPYLFWIFSLLCYIPIKSLYDEESEAQIALLEKTAKLLIIYTLLFSLGTL